MKLLRRRRRIRGMVMSSQPTGENFMPFPNGFDGSDWNPETGVYSPGTDIAGPATAAARFVVNNAGGGANNAAMVSDTWTYAGPDAFCLSMYVKRSFEGNDGTCNLRVQNSTHFSEVIMTYNWVGNVATLVGTSVGASGGGVISVGDDWYRVYVYADASAQGWLGDTVLVEFEPYGTDNVSGHGILVDGVQINAGTSPSAFVMPA